MGISGVPVVRVVTLLLKETGVGVVETRGEI